MNGEMDMSFKLKKSFQFKTSPQAKAFLEIAALYGKGRTFGSVVIFEASLDFVLWRKLQNLAMIVSESAIQEIDLYQATSQAGFKVFKKDTL